MKAAFQRALAILAGLALILSIIGAVVPSAYADDTTTTTTSTPTPSASTSQTEGSEDVVTAEAVDEPSESPTATATPSPTASATPTATPTPAPTKPPVTKPTPKTTAPQIWGHRGGGPGVPDNSVAAIRLGISSKSVAVLEFDMHMTKDHVWVESHDAKICGKVIRKTKYKKLKRCVTTFNTMTATVQGKKPVQQELKPSSITCKQSVKVFRQARKYWVNIQWASFHGPVLNKMYSCVKKEYNKKKYWGKYGRGLGTKLAGQMKFALIVRSCVSARTLSYYHARTVDLRYYQVGSSKTNLSCVPSLVAQGKAVALWTFGVESGTTAHMFAEAARVKATAVIVNDAAYAASQYPASRFFVSKARLV